MPRYTYRCDKCEFTLEIVHSMKECLTDCDQCDTKDVLVRVPAITFIKTSTPPATTGQQTGALVEQHIQDAKKELAKEKADLRVKDYKEKK